MRQCAGICQHTQPESSRAERNVMRMDEAVKSTSGLAEITRLRVKFRNSKSLTRFNSPVGRR
jgi:hypothetical protein